METSSLSKEGLEFGSIREAIDFIEKLISESKSKIAEFNKKIESLEKRLNQLKKLETEYISNMPEN